MIYLLCTADYPDCMLRTNLNIYTILYNININDVEIGMITGRNANYMTMLQHSYGPRIWEVPLHVWRLLLLLLFIQRIWTASEDILYDPSLFVFDSSAFGGYDDFPNDPVPHAFPVNAHGSISLTVLLRCVCCWYQCVLARNSRTIKVWMISIIGHITISGILNGLHSFGMQSQQFFQRRMSLLPRWSCHFLETSRTSYTLTALGSYLFIAIILHYRPKLELINRTLTSIPCSF